MGLIDDQYTQAKSLLRYLTDKGEISLLSYTEPNLTKNFLLQCASFHEDEIMEILNIFADKATDKKLANFIKYMIERQYFRLIQTENNNVNTFLSFFGHEFKEVCITEIDANSLLEDGIKSFIELAKLRGLIHKNLAKFNLEKTIDEVYETHNKAMVFIQYLKTKLLA